MLTAYSGFKCHECSGTGSCTNDAEIAACGVN